MCRWYPATGFVQSVLNTQSLSVPQFLCLRYTCIYNSKVNFSQACCTFSVEWSGWYTVSVLLQRFLVRDTQYYMLTQQNQTVLCMTQRHKHPMMQYLQVLAATRNIVVGLIVLLYMIFDAIYCHT